MRSLFFILTILNGLTMFTQSDSIKVPQEREDAIYLTYENFRRNIFISKEEVVSDLKKDVLDFMARTLSTENFTYTTPNGKVVTPSKDVWGFYQNKTLHVNYRDEFFRVPVFGSICYLVATVVVMNTGFYDPMVGYGINSGRAKEIREFIINFYDGVVSDFTMEKAEELLGKDPVLFAEYSQLSRRNRKEQVNRYIRRFNELHPVYFLK